MKKIIKSPGSLVQVVLVSLLALFVAVSVVVAATSIGSNISTGGTLYASSTALFSGVSTFYDTVTLSAANLFVSSGYGLDSTGVLNIGTSTATAITIGKAGVPARIFNASSTLANFGDGTTVSKLLYGTCTDAFGGSFPGTNIASTTSCTLNNSVTGLTTGQAVFVTPVMLEKNIVFNSASSTSATTIQIQIYNSSSTAVSIIPHTWYWFAIK